MLIKTGDEYVFSFNTSDAGGNVGEDEPRVALRNRNTGDFYNGIAFQDNPYYFNMQHVSNYSYIWKVIMNFPGNFEVIAKSKLDPSVTKEAEVDVYDVKAQSVAWVKDETYSVYYGNSGKDAKISIQRESDNYYYTGNDWVEEETLNSMSEFDDGIWVYDFTPGESMRYTISCTTVSEDPEEKITDDMLVFVLLVYESKEDVETVHISSASLLSPSGTDCKVIEDNDLGPIGGASVNLYTEGGKELVASVVTNSDGEWEMDVQPGTYLFVISKDGYENVSFTRTI